jgi:hypothetical protein
MSWTYAGNPNAGPVDETHFLLGDVDPSNPLATDEECLKALEYTHGNAYLAAADLAETKALVFALRPTSVKRGDRSTSWGDAAAAFRNLAATLRMRASVHTATVYAGGLSHGEKYSAAHDAALVQPFARKDLHSLWPPASQSGTPNIMREDY